MQCGMVAWSRSGHLSRCVRGWLPAATHDACQEAHSYLDAVADLEADLRIRAGSVRRGSSADRLLSLLPARPIFSVDSAAAAIERPTVATGRAVNLLTESGVLVVRSVGKQRYRIVEAPTSPASSPAWTEDSLSKALRRHRPGYGREFDQLVDMLPGLDREGPPGVSLARSE